MGLTDLHGKLINFNKILRYKPDVILISGDITHFGRDFRIIDLLKSVNENVKVLAVPGNCDTKEAIEKLNKYNLNIDEKCNEINGIKFVGIGGSNRTPFNTPNEYEDEELFNKFLKGIKDIDKNTLKNNFILVTHAPPKNTMADRVGDTHVGSEAVRKIIEEYQPILCACGHIHESRCIDKIGETIIVNPSPDAFFVFDTKTKYLEIIELKP
ncbi:metallophosphoesterase [Methanotorris igneus Kol 5]|uniref:Metallophosphoesterase n=2 Tax=Methanotorris igneus TaxID=2189 RepID=F6BAI7_METIK|nr:metallophosphoesterase [Methanotorris igneus Kol 5]